MISKQEKKRRLAQSRKDKNRQIVPRNKTRPRARTGMTLYDRMLYDPCNATLVPGIYGTSEGLLTRVRKTLSNNSPGSAGYIVWCPDYHGRESAFAWTTTDSSKRPTDTQLDPYGGGILWDADAKTAAFVQDPAHPLLLTDMVQDGRCLSACLQMTYFGPMFSSGGEVSVIENLPVSAILTGGPNNDPFTVDELFNFAASSHRLGTDTEELVYRTSDVNSSVFYDYKQDLVTNNGITELTPQASTRGPRLFGFVWRNIPTLGGAFEQKFDHASLTFVMLKNVEWRPQPQVGITQVPVSTSARSHVPLIQSKLDRSHPGWTHRFLSSVGSAVSNVARAALTGVPAMVSRYGPPLIEATMKRAPLLLTM